MGEMGNKQSGLSSLKAYCKDCSDVVQMLNWLMRRLSAQGLSAMSSEATSEATHYDFCSGEGTGVLSGTAPAHEVGGSYTILAVQDIIQCMVCSGLGRMSS